MNTRLKVGDLVTRSGVVVAKSLSKVVVRFGNDDEFVIVNTNDPEFVMFNTNDPDAQLKLRPLAIVEDDPVYQDDILYIHDEPVQLLLENSVVKVIWIDHGRVENLTYQPLSWRKQSKTRRQGWANIYGGPDHPRTNAWIYPTREKADEAARSFRQACIFIEWEEDLNESE